MQQYVFLHLSVIKQRYCSSYLIHVYLKFSVSRLSECMGVVLYFIYLCILESRALEVEGMVSRNILLKDITRKTKTKEDLVRQFFSHKMFLYKINFI